MKPGILFLAAVLTLSVSAIAKDYIARRRMGIQNYKTINCGGF